MPLNGNVLDLMKSYNAERRFRKLVHAVFAVNRFKAFIGGLSADKKLSLHGSNDEISEENAPRISLLGVPGAKPSGNSKSASSIPKSTSSYNYSQRASIGNVGKVNK